MNLQMNLSILSLDKGQDFGLYGKGMNSKGELFDWMVGCDGHGSNQIIDILKSIDWDKVMSKEDSLQEVLNIIDSYAYQSTSSGSTYMEAKIFSDRIETCSVGDSKIMVFIDENLVYENVGHTWENENEKERLKERIDKKRVLLSPVSNIPIALTPINISCQTKYYYHFENGHIIALTQSLGHNNITGIEPERKVIQYSPENKVRVILMSDGLTDVLSTLSEYYEKDLHILSHSSCSELASLAEYRWKQEWRYYPKNKDWPYYQEKDIDVFIPFCYTLKNSSSSGYDDVLVLTCDITPPLQTEPSQEPTIESQLDKETQTESDPLCLFKNMNSFVVHIFIDSNKYKICITTKIDIVMCYITRLCKKEDVEMFWSQFIDDNEFLKTEYFQESFSPAELDF